jgi:hypothetical protein
VEPDPPTTLADLLGRARVAYEALLAVGETIEDEWSETNDLASAWLARFDDVGGARGHDPVSGRTALAAAALFAEVGAIDDPHRAIDWLSTFPQVLLVAIGEQP